MCTCLSCVTFCSVRMSNVIAQYQSEWKPWATVGARSIMRSFGESTSFPPTPPPLPKRCHNWSARPFSSQVSTLFESGLFGITLHVHDHGHCHEHRCKNSSAKKNILKQWKPTNTGPVLLKNYNPSVKELTKFLSLWYNQESRSQPDFFEVLPPWQCLFKIHQRLFSEQTALFYSSSSSSSKVMQRTVWRKQVSHVG